MVPGTSIGLQAMMAFGGPDLTARFATFQTANRDSVNVSKESPPPPIGGIEREGAFLRPAGL